MSKLKAIIVDDERLSRVNLRRLLAPHHEIEIVAEAHSCNSAVEAIFQFNPEIIFLDIQLKGESGLDLLKITGRRVKIVFVTALEDYMLQVFAGETVDILLKPVNPDRLKLIVNRLLKMRPEKKSTVLRSAQMNSLCQLHC